jgi:hypothetical protein
MRTPDGRECAYYYEDYYRGADVQECRCPKDPGSAAWSPDLCARCPVPPILLHNGSPWLELTLRIRRMPLLGGRLSVTAMCTKHGIVIPDPIKGCPRDFEDLPPL